MTNHPNRARGAIGCGIETVAQATGLKLDHVSHKALSDATGIPAALLHIQDCFFERLTPIEARDWPVDFVAAIRPGTDLSGVTQRFLARVMREVVAHVEGAHFMERVADLVADVENDPAAAGEAVSKAARSVAGKASQIPDDDVTEWTAEALAARRAVVEAAERAAYTRMAAILLEELARAA